MSRSLIALAAGLLLATSALAAERRPTVTAPAGTAQGVARDGVRIFRGLPYALPPVGRSRWTPPVAPGPWAGTRDAAEFGPVCMQPPSRPGSIYAERYMAMSEDCLSLNIWTPAKARKLPVFVWIHGGSLLAGSGSQGMYDGTKLAKQGMVVVTINYRLGVFGYLAHPGLSAESPDRISGNYGLMDQIEALRWVRRNIAAYGGDPANVTIAGESAGALSVMYLMASPAARGLFHKAISQSAYMISTPSLREKRHGEVPAEETGAKLAEALGAKDVAALRALPAERLRDGAAKALYIPWGTVDGKLLPGQLVDIFDRGDQAPVPMLAGFNSGEIRSMRFLMPPPVDSARYETAIRANYGPLADAWLARYPAATVEESTLAQVRDAMYGWTAERLVARQTGIGRPSYLYMFDHGYPAADSVGLHAFHAAEIPFVFGTHARSTPLWPKSDGRGVDLAMTDAMVRYWSSFAKTGSPRAAGQPDWLPFTNAETFMLFANRPRMALRPLGEGYRLIETVVCRRRAAGDIAWNWNIGTISPPLPPESPQCR